MRTVLVIGLALVALQPSTWPRVAGYHPARDPLQFSNAKRGRAPYLPDDLAGPIGPSDISERRFVLFDHLLSASVKP